MAEINQPDNNSISSPAVTSGNNLTYNNWSGEESPMQTLQRSWAKVDAAEAPLNGASSIPISPNLINISGRYPTQMIGYDNEQLYAEGQGFLSKFGNAAVKTVGIAGTTFIDGTLGVINGVYKAASDQKLSSFYDNEFSRGLDDFNKGLEDKFANYKTEAERNREWNSVGNVVSNIFNANFIFDDVMKNMGFIAGMWGEAKLLSSVFKGIRTSAKLTAAAKAEDALSITDDIVRSGKYSTVGARTTDALNKTALFLTNDPAQRLIISGLSTLGESKIEALQTAREFKQEKINEYYNINGVEPTGEELQRIEQEASNAGNTTLGLNVALLTLSNYLVLPKLLGTSTKAERGIFNGIKTNAIKRGENKLWQEVPVVGFKKKLNVVKNVASLIVSPREGLEESAQFAVSTGAKNFFDKSYNNENPDIIDDLFGEGISQAFNTNEGIENFIIGALSGGIVESVQTVKENKARGLATQGLVKSLNERNILKFTPFTKDLVDSANRNTKLQAEKISALRQGDVLEMKDIERDIAHNYLLPRIKHDRFDLVQDDIAQYQKLASTEEGFQQLKDEGVVGEEETVESFSARIANVQRHAVLMQNQYQSLGLKYGAEIDTKGNLKYSNTNIDFLVYNSSKIADYSIRIPALQQALIANGVNTATIVDTIDKQKAPSAEEVSEAINYINGLNVTTDEKNELKIALSDTIEMALRRNDAIKEFDDILKNPSNYNVLSTSDITDSEVIDEDAPEILPEREYIQKNPKLFTIKENDDKFDLVDINGEVVSTFNTKEEAEGQQNFENDKIKQLSSIKVLRKTQAGVYEVAGMQGNVEYLSPSQLADYELVKTDAETAAEREDLNKDISEDQEGGNNNDGADNPPTDDVLKDYNPSTTSKKTHTVFFNSGTQNQDEDLEKARGKNLNTFLANAFKFPNRKSLRVTVISPANAEKLGIQNYRDFMLQGATDLAEPISFVAIEESGNQFYFVDKEGNKIGKVGEGLYEGFTNDDLIINTLPDTKTNWGDKYKGENRFRIPNTTPQEEAVLIGEYATQWRRKREEILNNPDAFDVFDFRISRGIAQRYPSVDGRRARNSIATSIVNPEDINNQGLIQVNLTGSITTNEGENIGFPKGALVLEYGPTLEPLENRRLTEKEAITIYTLLSKIAYKLDDPAFSPKSDNEYQRFMTYIRGIVYTGDKTTNNRIHFANGVYFIGKDFAIPATSSSFESRRKEIIEELQKIYTVANNKKLKLNQQFEEITGIDKEGNLKTRDWNSYQEFLISDEGRDVSSIPFTTSIINPAIFKNRYITTPDFFAPVEPEINKPVEPTPTPETSDIQVFESANGNVNYTKDSIGEITIIQDESLDAVIATIKEKQPVFASVEESDLKNNIVIPGLIMGIKEAAQAPQPATTVDVKAEQKVEKQIKENPPKEETLEDDDNPLRGEFRRVQAHWDYNIGNIAVEQKWFEDRFNIPFYRLDNLIKATGGGYAWGMFADNAVYVYNNAQEGTTYHEAFEAVWFMFTDTKEKAKILNEFNSRTGTYIDAVSGKIIKYSEATEQESKEQLAEEFRSYVLNQKLAVKPVPNKNFIGRMFAQLRAFIQKFFVSSDAKSNTQELFEKIDAGYYKTASPINFNTSPQYSRVNENNLVIKGLSAQDSYSVVQGVTGLVFRQLFKEEGAVSLLKFDNPTQTPSEVYSKVYKQLEDIYTTDKYPESVMNLQDDELKKKYINIWNIVKADWQGTKDLTNQYLKTFGVNVKQVKALSLDGEEVIDGFDDENTETSSREDSYLIDMFSYDFIKKSPTSIKLLLGTTPEGVNVLSGTKTEVIKKLDPATYMTKLVDTNTIFNNIMTRLSGINSMEGKKKVMLELAKGDGTYAIIARKLNLTNKEFSEFTWDEHALWIRFLNVFSKQRPEALVEFITPEGSTLLSQNTNIAAKEIAQGWVDSWKAEGSPLVKSDNGQYIFDNLPIRNSSVKEVKDQINFLKLLNIDITEDDYKKLTPEQKKALAESLKYLQNYLGDKTGITSVNLKSFNEDRAFVNLANLYLDIKKLGYPSTFRGMDGNQKQNDINLNTVSYMINDLNQYDTIEELYAEHPEYQQLNSSESLYLTEILFKNGKRNRDETIGIAYVDGQIDNSTERESRKANSTLSEASRLISNINSNIKGYYNMMVPADAKTEWMIKMKHIFTYESFNQGDILDKVGKQLTKYYNVEKKLAGKNKKYNGLLFPSFAGENQEFSLDKFKDYLETEKEAIKNTLQNSNILEPKGGGEYTINKLNAKFKDDNGLNTFSEVQLDNFLNFYVTNVVANNIELHKLFFGDPNEIAMKRYKSFSSGVERSQDYATLNIALNEKYNTVNGIKLTKGTPGYQEHKPFLSTAVYEDVTTSTPTIVNDKSLPKSTRDAYTNTNAADAQAKIMFTAYREMSIKRNAGFTEGQEKQAEYLNALSRLLVDEDSRAGIVPEELKWIYPNKQLKEYDKELVAQGNPNSGKFPPIKPLAAGQATLNTNSESFAILDKYSMYPLWYSMYRTVDEKGKVQLQTNAILYLKMLKSGIDYTIFESGRKVGKKTLNKLYTEDGKVNLENYLDITNIPYKYIGTQVETEGEKTKGKSGKQLSVLDKSDLLDAGIPKDVANRYTLEQWLNLTPTEKEEESEIFKKITRTNKLLSERLVAGYEQLLKKLSIIDTGERFEVSDYGKVEKLLQEELLRREAPQNKKSSIRLNTKTNTFDIPFEATSAYREIQDILFAYVDKLIARPKFNGGQRILVANTGFEINGERVKVQNYKGNDVLTSAGLNFYKAEYSDPENPTNENRISVARCEIYLPNFFAEKLRAAGFKKTNEELIKFLTNSDEGKRILQGVAFRIPTQNLNSADAFIIKGFLPEEMGDSVVFPDAITTKAGSDFDVDKMNMYLKNVYIDSKGNPRLMQLENIDTSNEEQLTDFYEEHLLNRYQAKKGEQKSLEAADKLFQDIADKYIETEDDIDLETPTALEKIPSIEEFLVEAKTLNIYELNKKYNRHPYSLILENEYFESVEELLLLPLNFPRLVQPNSKQQLVDIKDELVKAAPSEFGIDGKNIRISPSQLTHLRHVYVSAKGGVGIAALGQTSNAMAQATPLYLHPDNVYRIDPKLREHVPNLEIKLPHNTIDIVENGIKRTYATVSKVKDVSKQEDAISNTLSQYIDGFVDTVNDPFIAQLLQGRVVTPTSVAMVRLGMDPRQAFFFINQPIIREHVKSLLNSGSGNIYFFKALENTRAKFASNDRSDLMLSPSTLLSTITQYYETPNALDNYQRGQQLQIFDEFLKYSVIAQSLNDITQGVSYDSDRKGDPTMRQVLNRKTIQALNNNLFSGVEGLIKGNSMETLIDTTNRGSIAVNTSIFKLSTPRVRNTLSAVLNQVLQNKYIKAEELRKIGRQINTSFIDFMMQTNEGLNTDIQRLIFENAESVAIRLAKLKTELRSRPNSDLAQNPILRNLIPAIKNNKADAKSVLMIFRSNKAFVSDRYTQAFRELKQNPVLESQFNGLYGDLIKLAFLQSGVGMGQYTQYIPYEDFETYITPIFNNLENYDNIEAFHTTGTYFKNNWNNPDLVGAIENPETEDYRGIPVRKFSYIPEGDWYKELLVQKGIDTSFTKHLYKLDTQKSESSYSFITTTDVYEYEGTDIVNTYKTLLQRLEDASGNPVKVPHYFGDYYIYFPVNALGNGFSGVEHYNNSAQMSKYTNGFTQMNLPSAEEVYKQYLENLEISNQLNIGDEVSVVFIINNKPIKVSTIVESVDREDGVGAVGGEPYVRNNVVLLNPNNKKRYVITYVDGEYITAGTIVDGFFNDNTLGPESLKIDDNRFLDLIKRTRGYLPVQKTMNIEENNVSLDIPDEFSNTSWTQEKMDAIDEAYNRGELSSRFIVKYPETINARGVEVSSKKLQEIANIFNESYDPTIQDKRFDSKEFIRLSGYGMSNTEYKYAKDNAELLETLLENYPEHTQFESIIPAILKENEILVDTAQGSLFSEEVIQENKNKLGIKKGPCK